MNSRFLIAQIKSVVYTILLRTLMKYRKLVVRAIGLYGELLEYVW